MKTKKLSGWLLLFLCTIGLVGCGSDDEKNEIYSLSFEKGYYEVPMLGKTSIMIRGGNRDYAVTVGNPGILDAAIDLSSSVSMGDLVIEPKSKGETTVTIKDNKVEETVVLRVKVIDRYLAYAIEESNHPALSKGVIVYLINNEAKDCYFFRYINSINQVSDTPIAKGTYGFSVKLESGSGNSSPLYGIPYLTLNYASDENGHFTDAAIPPTPHKLRFEMYDGITNTSVIPMIASCLGVDWEELAKATLKGNRSNMIVQPTLKTTVDDTDYVIIGNLDITPVIPENYLN